MEIRIRKKEIKFDLVCFALLLIVLDVVWIYFREPIWLIIFTTVFGIYIMTKQTLLCYKSVTLSEDGYTVTFLWFKKSYHWESIATKRIQYYTRPGITRSSKIESHIVVFSPTKVPLFKLFSPQWYFIVPFINAFSIVHFHLTGSENNSFVARYNKQPEIDETLFFSKMNEWGIELEKIDYHGFSL